MGRVRFWVALAVVLALVLGGCRTLGLTGRPAAGEPGGGANRPDASGPIHVESHTWDEMVVEYRASLAALEWPAGAVPSPNLSNPDKASNYAIGYGEGMATFDWQCTWGRVYLRSLDTDHAAAAKALDVLSTVTKLPAWESSLSDPNTRKFILDEIERARAGDPTLIRQDQLANC